MITEEGRHRMYRRLEDVLGHEEATMLMEHLPPVGWADVATRHDLDMIRLEMRALSADIRGELQRDMRLQTYSLIAAFTALNGILLAATRL